MRISDWSSDVCSSDLRIAPQVAEAKAHQRALLGIVNADVALDQFLGLGTRDLDVEVAVPGVLGGTDQCGDGACQKGLRAAATPDGNLAGSLDVADARGVEVEIRFLVGCGIGKASGREIVCQYV